jgi:hypothetical protein
MCIRRAVAPIGVGLTLLGAVVCWPGGLAHADALAGAGHVQATKDPESLKRLFDAGNPTKVKKSFGGSAATNDPNGKPAGWGKDVTTTQAQLTWTSTATDGISLMATGLGRYQIDTTDWANVRGIKGSFTVGLGHDNWGMDVAFDHPGTDQNWYYGYIGGGALERCLWIGTPSLDPASNTPTRNCTSTPDLQPRDYMAAYNGNRPGINCSNSQCDGTSVALNFTACPQGVPVFANMQPWQGLNGLVTGPLYAILPTASVKSVRWRYLTRDTRGIMMRYTGDRSGVAQDWGFIPSKCIQPASYIEWVQ